MSAVSLWKLETYFFLGIGRCLIFFSSKRVSFFFFLFSFFVKNFFDTDAFPRVVEKTKVNRNSPRFWFSLLFHHDGSRSIPFTGNLKPLQLNGRKGWPRCSPTPTNGIVRRIDVFSRYPTEDRGKMTEAFFTLRVGWAGRNPFPISSVSHRSYPWMKRYACA